MRSNNVEELIYEKHGHVATLTLNNPDKLNVFTVGMIKGWIDALKESQDDEAIRVIVVTGNGRVFSAGGNLDAMEKGEGFFPLYDFPPIRDKADPYHKKRSLWELIHRVPLTLEDVDKPIIAAVNGDAIGAGCDMTLMCDLRVAAKEARFCEAYVKIGLVPGDGGSFFLPRLVGLSKGLELLWTGDVITADEAYRIGLVNMVVARDRLMEEVYRLAERLAERPPIVLRLIKRAVYQGLKTDLRTHLDLISSHMAIVSEMDDHREGLMAFRQRRKPVFEGK